MSKKVFIGVGHGGSDSGAVANGFKEKDVNLDIALCCRNFLVNNGVITGISRTIDENDRLAEEIKECNSFKPDFAVEIHNNAGGGDGCEIFHYSKGGASKTLAEFIEKEIKKIGQNSRGLKTKLGSDKRDYFGWIRETTAPAVIVECAFLDSNDVKIIDSYAKRKTMGEAIAKGIMNALGIAEKPVEKTLPKPTVPAEQKYTVKKNDSLYVIAVKNNTTIANLVRLNKAKYPSLSKNPSLIYPGWILTIK